MNNIRRADAEAQAVRARYSTETGNINTQKKATSLLIYLLIFRYLY